MNISSIKIVSSQLDTGKNMEMTEDEARRYAGEQLKKTLDGLDVDPNDAIIVLSTEGAVNDPVQKCGIKLTIDGTVIKQSAHSRTVKKAIDRAIPDVRRQVNRMKTRRIDRKRNMMRKGKRNGISDTQETIANMADEKD